jgi:hypothetical protein
MPKGSSVSLFQSCTSGRRSRFTWERRRFWAILRSPDAFVGRVGRRGGGGGAIAAVRTSMSRLSAASRFRNCERFSAATIVMTPPTSRPARRSSARARRVGPNAVELATSKSNSTRESVVFTPCPPGPDDRENRQTNSDSGITLERTRSGPGTRQGCSLPRCGDHLTTEGGVSPGLLRDSLPIRTVMPRGVATLARVCHRSTYRWCRLRRRVVRASRSGAG